jgi:hypothetical protein
VACAPAGAGRAGQRFGRAGEAVEVSRQDEGLDRLDIERFHGDGCDVGLRPAKSAISSMHSWLIMAQSTGQSFPITITKIVFHMIF